MNEWGRVYWFLKGHILLLLLLLLAIFSVVFFGLRQILVHVYGFPLGALLCVMSK